MYIHTEKACASSHLYVEYSSHLDDLLWFALLI